jgi:hypothetical protein
MYHGGVQATAALRVAVARADQVFEERLSRPATLCMHCDGGGLHSPDRERLDAILLAHRSHRLTLPVEAVARLGLGHGSAMVHQSLRRFAWFVPPLLAATLEPDNFAVGLTRFAVLAEEARRDAAESVVRALGTEPVRATLEARALAESDATLAEALSSAESVVSGWIAATASVPG